MVYFEGKTEKLWRSKSWLLHIPEARFSQEYIRQETRQVQGQAVKAAHRLGSDPVKTRVRHHLAIAMEVHTDKKN